MKISKKFRKMCDVYKLFGCTWNCDFSEAAMKAMYDYESRGIGNLTIDNFNNTSNGYAVGKKWLNVQVSMWLKDFSENRLFARMCLKELYSDIRYPKWWLDSIFMIPEFENMG